MSRNISLQNGDPDKLYKQVSVENRAVIFRETK